MFLSRGDRDLGVAFQTHPGRQAFISSGSKEPRSALEWRRVSTFKVLAKLQGVLEYVAKKSEVNYYIIPPATWKHNTGVTGRSRPDQKKSAQLIVQRLYNVQATQDESDAILLGKYGVDKVKNNRMVNFEN